MIKLDVFKALNDKNRLKILKHLSCDNKCACHLLEELQITQPTLSHHMQILINAKIVNEEKIGKWKYYSINKKTINKVIYYLEDIIKEC